MQLRTLTTACLLAAFANLPRPAVAAELALIHCQVFDGIENGILEDATVLVSDGRIERIAGDGATAPAGYETIDCEGNYLAPGLIDVHTHLDNPEAMQRALDSGTTTV